MLEGARALYPAPPNGCVKLLLFINMADETLSSDALVEFLVFNIDFFSLLILGPVFKGQNVCTIF